MSNKLCIEKYIIYQLHIEHKDMIDITVTHDACRKPIKRA